MVSCPGCGLSLGDGAIYCPVCGWGKVATTTQPIQADAPSGAARGGIGPKGPPASPDSDSRVEPSTRRKALAYVLGLGGLACWWAAIYVVFPFHQGRLSGPRLLEGVCLVIAGLVSVIAIEWVYPPAADRFWREFWKWSGRDY